MLLNYRSIMHNYFIKLVTPASNQGSLYLGRVFPDFTDFGGYRITNCKKLYLNLEKLVTNLLSRTDFNRPVVQGAADM